MQDLAQKEVNENLPYLEGLAPDLLGTVFPMVNEYIGKYGLQFEVPYGLMLDLGWKQIRFRTRGNTRPNRHTTRANSGPSE